MTEQQILAKTIEYLNKYSLCFSLWEYKLEEHPIYGNQVYLTGMPTENNIIKISKNYSCKAKNTEELVMDSEFRIAYNIIKDLAQHENEDQTGNANFGHLI